MDKLIDILIDGYDISLTKVNEGIKIALSRENAGDKKTLKCSHIISIFELSNAFDKNILFKGCLDDMLQKFNNYTEK